MTEIEELKKQVRELQRKIESMTMGEVAVGRAKLDLSTTRQGVWRLSYHVELNDVYNWKVINAKWVNLAQSSDREKVIDEIPKVISDMQKLYDALKAKESKDEREGESE